MNRTSLAVLAARQFQRLPLRILRFLEWPFSMRAKTVEPFQGLIILALPRSGSTVTYQAICQGLSVQYLSNVWNLLYQLPLLAGLLSSRLSLRHRSSFQSHHGFVSGIAGPSEGLRFWEWWSDCGLSDEACALLPAQTRQRRVRYLNKVLSWLSRDGRPFATAYLGHALMPDSIDEAFQGAALIRLRRDPVANGLSLLRAARGGSSDWFSVVPRECAALGVLNEYERVAAQVYWLNRRLDDAACSSGFLIVDYEDLCKKPAVEIARIRDWCRKRGIMVEYKFGMPESFEYRKADIETDPDAININQALKRLEIAHGALRS